MLEKSLSALWQKQQLITNNIANEDTPGYKAKRMEFENLLRKEMDGMARVSAVSRKEQLARIEDVSPQIYDDEATEVRADGNNVNIHNEQIELARAQIQYDALQRKISGHYSTLKYAISGGR
jgi:flagellar basal-body rod protein FlgB